MLKLAGDVARDDDDGADVVEQVKCEKKKLSLILTEDMNGSKFTTLVVLVFIFLICFSCFTFFSNLNVSTTYLRFGAFRK